MRHESLIRLCAFVAVLLAMAAWETLAPRRKLTVGRVTRWPSNIGVVMVNTALLRLILPAGAVGFAFFCSSRGWGCFMRCRYFGECIECITRTWTLTLRRESDFIRSKS